ncbi:MAG TPA: hypothetical protein VIJ15_01405, partial [Dermatophilaceae bacterium]
GEQAGTLRGSGHADREAPWGMRGERTRPSLLSKITTPLTVRIQRRSGDRFGGMDLLALIGSREESPCA